MSAAEEELPDIKGTPPATGPDGEEREETDSGFAQGDRVFSVKRGPGVIKGFFGEVGPFLFPNSSWHAIRAIPFSPWLDHSSLL